MQPALSPKSSLPRRIIDPADVRHVFLSTLVVKGTQLDLGLGASRYRGAEI